MYNKRYKGVDGRTYVLEPNMSPLPLRTKLYPRYGVVYESMSATELWRIENFFSDKKSKKFVFRYDAVSIELFALFV